MSTPSQATTVTTTADRQQPSTTETTIQPATQPPASQPQGVLRLRGAPTRNAPRVTWTEDVVDNEGCGKKKSKSAQATWFVRRLMCPPAHLISLIQSAAYTTSLASLTRAVMKAAAMIATAAQTAVAVGQQHASMIIMLTSMDTSTYIDLPVPVATPTRHNLNPTHPSPRKLATTSTAHFLPSPVYSSSNISSCITISRTRCIPSRMPLSSILFAHRLVFRVVATPYMYSAANVHHQHAVKRIRPRSGRKPDPVQQLGVTLGNYPPSCGWLPSRDKQE